VNEGRMEYKCQCCGISEWLDKPISLQLDHINGINNDHRIENLRFLCPNCHSQTDTYAGKNIGR
jgi:5-methylcytosine-specific restriction endonuclease McrA